MPQKFDMRVIIDCDMLVLAHSNKCGMVAHMTIPNQPRQHLVSLFSMGERLDEASCAFLEDIVA